MLETALRIDELTGADVEAVHVAHDAFDTPESLAQRSGVPFRVLNGVGCQNPFGHATRQYSWSKPPR